MVTSNRSESSKRAKAESYRDLLVGQKGIELAKEVYAFTAHFPAEEKFGLVSQMRRAAVSIPSNVAEGQARRTTGEFVQFLSHAEGSVAELDTQIHLAHELAITHLSATEKARALLTELRLMLNSLRRKLEIKR